MALHWTDMCFNQQGNDRSGDWELLEAQSSSDGQQTNKFEGVVHLKKQPGDWIEHVALVENGTLCLYTQTISKTKNVQVRVRLTETDIVRHGSKFKFEARGARYTMRPEKSDLERLASVLQHFRKPPTSKKAIVPTTEAKQIQDVIRLAIDSLSATIEALREMSQTFEKVYGQSDSETPVEPVSDTHSPPSCQPSTESLLLSGMWRTSLPAEAPKIEPFPLRLIYQQLTKEHVMHVPMRRQLPPSFYKPLSFAQETALALANSHLLDQAAQAEDPVDRMALVSAFIFSCYWSHYQTHKPFESYLGETYELDRSDDLGWRHNAERVRIEPPLEASFTESKYWCWNRELGYRFSCDLLNDIFALFPTYNLTCIELKSFKEQYRWNKCGEEIHNFSRPSATFSSHRGAVVVDCSSGVQCQMNITPTTHVDGKCRLSGHVLIDGQPKADLTARCSLAGRVFRKNRETLLNEPDLRPNHKKYYGFRPFDMTINQMCDGLPKTDSRHRPDLRLMEKGFFEEAMRVTNDMDLVEHERLKDIKPRISEYKPLFFSSVHEEDGTSVWKTNGTYWKQKKMNFKDLDLPKLW